MWNKQIETMPRKEMEQLQLQRLRATVKKVYDNVPFYRKRLEEAKITRTAYGRLMI